MIFRYVTGADTVSSTATAKRDSASRCKLAVNGTLLAATLAFVTMTSAAQAAGDAAAGAIKAHTCLGCHGVKHYVNTYPSYHVPRIAGQHEEYLVAALQAYRAKTRSHPTMQANAGLLTDQDIEDISAWFAAQGASK